ncbi:alpha/beta fold hydrolase [Rhodopila sp.]|uniref:alpha/beta fold hydrolase n=1 Tax=Rhodopila sp. TaxID=2480087 RepID=UPI003D0C4658
MRRWTVIRRCRLGVPLWGVSLRGVSLRGVSSRGVSSIWRALGGAVVGAALLGLGALPGWGRPVASVPARHSVAALRTEGTALPPGVTDHFFLSSDGVRLHYLEAGPPGGHTLVFVPGWTMPAWIWMPQIEAFSRRYRVVAFDPRGQGDSAVPATGYEPRRRGRDVAELIRHLDSAPVVVIGWSLGVLDTLASIHVAGDRWLAGLVLVDNSVGEEPPPAPYRPGPPRRGPPPNHATAMASFVRAMFHHTPPAGYLDRLTQDALHTPETASRRLLAYPVPRSYWREAVYATKVPLLYVIRPRWVAQGENLVRHRPNTEMDVFDDAGHALFVDDAARFNRVMERFLQRYVWP